MPNASNGFTGTEIVDRIIKYIGNTSPDFKSYVQNTLPLAEYRFYKMHDWGFLHKAGLSLAITNGTSEYELSTANIGFTMYSEDVETIYLESQGMVLRRVDLNQIRRMDSDDDDGSTKAHPQVWAPIDDQRIKLWPPNFETDTLSIDGRVMEAQLNNLANYPLIPYKYQESFIEYVMGIALDRENDNRAPNKKAEAFELIKIDIKDDLRQLSNVDNPRLRHWREARFDGVGSSLDAYVWGMMWYPYES